MTPASRSSRAKKAPLPAADDAPRILSADELRRRAEERLGVYVAPAPAPGTDVIHELEVHQIELEMQNEELRLISFDLDAQRARFLDLFELAPVGYLTLNEKNFVRDANLAAARMLGIERRQLIGRPLSAFMSQADADALYLDRTLLKRTGKPQHRELSLRREDAEPLWVLLEWQSQVAAEGRAPSVHVTFTDISARKEAEESLRESGQNLRDVLAAVDDIIVVGTPDGRIAYANPAAAAKLGYSAADLEAMQVLDLHPPGTRTEAETVYTAIWRGEQNTHRLPLQNRSGALIPVDTRVWFGQWNGVDCVFGASRDPIREREVLHEFDWLFRRNPALAAMSSLPDGRFTEINDIWLQTLGYAREEVLGRTAEDLDLFVDPELQRAAAEQLQAQGRVSDLELQVRRKDGTVADGLFSGEIIESHGRQLFLTVMTDQTERKRAEEALRQVTDRLSLAVRASAAAPWDCCWCHSVRVR